MPARIFSYEAIKLILAAIMAFCLVLTLASGTASIIFNGQPYGETARLVADLFAWLFTAAFLIAFVLTLFEERSRQCGIAR